MVTRTSEPQLCPIFMAMDWQTDSRRMEFVDSSNLCCANPGQLLTYNQAFRAMAPNNGNQELVVCDQQ